MSSREMHVLNTYLKSHMEVRTKESGPFDLTKDKKFNFLAYLVAKLPFAHTHSGYRSENCILRYICVIGCTKKNKAPNRFKSNILEYSLKDERITLL